MILDELALKYGTDKGSNGHFYTRHYEKIFDPIRQEVESLLEVGVAGGASLQMWRDYFIGAEIYGVDQNHCGDFGSRIRTFEGDQTDSEFLLSNFRDKRLEIIVDDASHDQDKTMQTLEILWSVLQPNGWYVIEDMDRHSFAERIGKWFGEHQGEIRKLYILANSAKSCSITFIQKQ